jgi:hypothetical protein
MKVNLFEPNPALISIIKNPNQLITLTNLTNQLSTHQYVNILMSSTIFNQDNLHIFA